MKITLVAGARPNFIKIAPLIHALKNIRCDNPSVSYRLIHTGQHYDRKLSGQFFDDLNIPSPDVNLGVGSGTHAEQTAKIMLGFEKELIGHPCHWVIVVGDVNSTMACSIVAKKLNINVAHVEAGLRSFDSTMPEEINRCITDAIADAFYTTTKQATEYLLNIGIAKEKVQFVGNTMIDTLMLQGKRFKPPKVLEKLHNTVAGMPHYFLLTLHRPSNVDDEKKMIHLLNTIKKEAQDSPIIFPIHPRTLARLQHAQYNVESEFMVCEPLPYLEFMYVLKHSKAIITDSGGIQEEATFLHIPCLTLRDNTERPETITLGTNRLVGNDERKIKKAFADLMSKRWHKGSIPPLWDGKAATRVIAHLLQL